MAVNTFDISFAFQLNDIDASLKFKFMATFYSPVFN